MRILRVISTMNPRVGGPVAGLRAITPILLQHGHSTEFLTTDSPDDLPAELDGCPIHRIGPGKGGYEYTSNLVPWLTANHARFDAVIVHGLWQYLGRAVRIALKGTTTPYYVFPHGMLDPWFSRAYPIKHLKKWLYWQATERFVLRDARAVLFTCEQERLLAATSFRPYECREMVVSYGAARPIFDLPRSKSEFRKKHPTLGQDPYFLFLGRIHPKKGLRLLIKAYAELYHERHGKIPRLVIAGPCESPAYQDSLKKLSGHCGVDHAIQWIGLLQGELKWGALGGAEALVLPSHQENFGIVIAEALAVGRPVLISTQVNIWREIVRDQAGFAAADTIKGTTELLRSWLSLSGEKQAAMSAAAIRCFNQNFEIAAVARSLAGALARREIQTEEQEISKSMPKRAQEVRPLRLLQDTTSMDPHVGGPPAVLQAITPVLTEMGHYTEFATCESPRVGEDTLLGCPIHRLGPPRMGYQYTALLSTWIKEHGKNFDAVFVHGLWQHHGLSTHRALKSLGIPYFVYPHGMLDPWFKRAYPLKHIKKWLYWNFIERKLLRDASAVLFTCDEERRLARESFPGYQCTERVIEFGTARPSVNKTKSIDAFTQAFPQIGEKPFLLFISRIHPKKGVDLLLKAYGRLKQQHPENVPALVIAGPCKDASYIAALKKIEKAHCPVGAVHWTGMLEGEVKWGALFRCEAFVLPSHQENFGIAVAEAMAVARPVIISNKVNIWREIQIDKAGIIGEDTLEGTLSSMTTWFHMNAHQRSLMGEAAQKCFEKRFEISSVARSLVATIGPFLHANRGID